MSVGGTNFTGTGQFKFALVAPDGAAEKSLWSHDGTSVNGGEPGGSSISILVMRGVFSVELGDTTVANMTQAIPASLFTNNVVYLRVWFNDGSNGWQRLTPDRRVTSVGYALTAAYLLGPASTATNFSGSLAGDVTGAQSSTVVGHVGGATAADVAAAVSVVKGATSENTPGAIAVRNSNGDFKVGTITGAFVGNGAGLNNLDASAITSGTLADARLSTAIARGADVAAQVATASNGLSARLVGTNDAILSLLQALTAQVGKLSAELAAITNQTATVPIPGLIYASPDPADSQLIALGLQPISSIAAPGWLSSSASGEPNARYGHTAVWTGQEMIIWGGQLGSSQYSAAGGWYRPDLDSWQAVSTVAAPSQRSGHTAVWTGREMIVWGGFSGSAYLNTGGRFVLSNQTWSAVSTTGAPSQRDAHVAAWTGARLLIWGGRGQSAYLADGGVYDPSNDTWAPLSLPNAPGARAGAAGVWAGDRWFIWGGDGDTDYLNTGAQLVCTGGIPSQWTTMSTTGAPAARSGHSLVWTGSRLLVWGGINADGYLGDGAAYDPTNNTWSTLATSNAPLARAWHTATWTGTEMVIYGGETSSGTAASGAAYNPKTDRWRLLPNPGSPQARSEATAVWSGSEVIFFGGRSAGTPLAVLQRLSPQPTWYFFRKL